MILSTHLLADVEAVCREILVLRRGELLARETVDSVGVEPQQVYEVEGFGAEDAFLAGLQALGAQVARDQRLMLVTLDLTTLPAAREGTPLAPAMGVEAILRVAATSDFALRRVRRRPVTLAEEFYKMVEA